MSKSLAVKAKLYVVLWQYDEAHGDYRERRRILAINAEDAIERTRPNKLNGARLIRAETLAENIEIAVTKELWVAAWGHDNLPYGDDSIRELLEELND